MRRLIGLPAGDVSVRYRKDWADKTAGRMTEIREISQTVSRDFQDAVHSW